MILLFGAATYVTINEKIKDKKLHEIPEIQKLDAIYNFQKENYEEKLDSLKQDYEMRLNKLGTKLKWK